MASSSYSNFNDVASSPYHVVVVYLLDDDGYLGGGFRIEPMNFRGGVCARSLDALLVDCYESLEVGIEMSDNVPFDTTDIRKSVVFDFVECLNEDEFDVAATMKRAGDTFENITEAIQQ
jgi:hypothetical protein